MSTGIRMENCKGVVLRGNRVIGFDEGIVAVNCEDINAEKNTVLDRSTNLSMDIVNGEHRRKYRLGHAISNFVSDFGSSVIAKTIVESSKS